MLPKDSDTVQEQHTEDPATSPQADGYLATMFEMARSTTVGQPSCRPQKGLFVNAEPAPGEKNIPTTEGTVEPESKEVLALQAEVTSRRGTVIEVIKPHQQFGPQLRQFVSSTLPSDLSPITPEECVEDERIQKEVGMLVYPMALSAFCDEVDQQRSQRADQLGFPLPMELDVQAQEVIENICARAIALSTGKSNPSEEKRTRIAKQIAKVADIIYDKVPSTPEVSDATETPNRGAIINATVCRKLEDRRPVAISLLIRSGLVDKRIIEDIEGEAERCSMTFDDALEDENFLISVAYPTLIRAYPEALSPLVRASFTSGEKVAGLITQNLMPPEVIEILRGQLDESKELEDALEDDHFVMGVAHPLLNSLFLNDEALDSDTDPNADRAMRIYQHRRKAIESKNPKRIADLFTDGFIEYPVIGHIIRTKGAQSLSEVLSDQRFVVDVVHPFLEMTYPKTPETVAEAVSLYYQSLGIGAYLYSGLVAKEVINKVSRSLPQEMDLREAFVNKHAIHNFILPALSDLSPLFEELSHSKDADPGRLSLYIKSELQKANDWMEVLIGARKEVPNNLKIVISQLEHLLADIKNCTNGMTLQFNPERAGSEEAKEALQELGELMHPASVDRHTVRKNAVGDTEEITFRAPLLEDEPPRETLLHALELLQMDCDAVELTRGNIVVIPDNRIASVYGQLCEMVGCPLLENEAASSEVFAHYSTHHKGIPFRFLVSAVAKRMHAKTKGMYDKSHDYPYWALVAPGFTEHMLGSFSGVPEDKILEAMQIVLTQQHQPGSGKLYRELDPPVAEASSVLDFFAAQRRLERAGYDMCYQEVKIPGRKEYNREEVVTEMLPFFAGQEDVLDELSKIAQTINERVDDTVKFPELEGRERQKNFPNVYVVGGPPGSGKTSSLCELLNYYGIYTIVVSVPGIRPRSYTGGVHAQKAMVKEFAKWFKRMGFTYEYGAELVRKGKVAFVFDEANSLIEEETGQGSFQTGGKAVQKDLREPLDDQRTTLEEKIGDLPTDPVLRLFVTNAPKFIVGSWTGRAQEKLQRTQRITEPVRTRAKGSAYYVPMTRAMCYEVLELDIATRVAGVVNFRPVTAKMQTAAWYSGSSRAQRRRVIESINKFAEKLGRYNAEISFTEEADLAVLTYAAANAERAGYRALQDVLNALDIEINTNGNDLIQEDGKFVVTKEFVERALKTIQ